MEGIELIPPKRKRCSQVYSGFPFPVNLSCNSTSSTRSHISSGIFQGNCVEVYGNDDIKTLSSMGFFGTIWQNGRNHHNEINVPLAEHLGDVVVMEKKRFDCHKEWNELQEKIILERGEGEKNSRKSAKRKSHDDQHSEELKHETASKVLVIDSEHQDMPCFIADDPFPPKPCLLLTLSEAFFLSFGLGCLVVKKNNKLIDLKEMWNTYNAQDAQFVSKYTVYHHFRSKGWVVKSGIKFGSDFLLYKKGPPFYHASYSVVVHQVTEETLSTCHTRRKLTWASLAGLNRITEHVAKELLMCYVLQPANLDIHSPECIKKLKVQEVLLRRWVASEQRMNKPLHD